MDSIPGSIDENLTVVRTSLPTKNGIIRKVLNANNLKISTMKKIFLWGAFTLLTTTLFSCTADEFETAEGKTEIKKDINQLKADGPDDDPIPVKPPIKNP